MLKGKKIFITGGSSGIGKACAQVCLKEGAQITIMDIASDEALQAEKEELGKNCYVIHGDVTNLEDVAKAVAYAKEQMGGLTGAINVAGSQRLGRIVDMTAEDFDWTVKLCMYGVFYCLKEEAKILKETGGSIVNISSLNSQIPGEGFGAYNTAKAGVDNLTRTAAVELAPYNVRVNAIRPGFTATDAIKMMAQIPEYNQLALDRIPMNRFVEPEEIGNMAAFLLTDKVQAATGALFAVDGGIDVSGYPKVYPILEGFMAAMAAQAAEAKAAE